MRNIAWGRLLATYGVVVALAGVILFGWLRYRYHSTWLTVVLHGINNFAATLQSIWLAG